MKKQIAMMMAVAMTAVSIGTVAYAADVTAVGSTPENPLEFSYEDIDASVYEGEWVDTGLGFDVYLPQDWVEVDLTEEMLETGLFYQAGEEGGGANISITCMELPEEVADTYDLLQLGTELAASNTTAMFVNFNEIPGVCFENEESKITGFSFLEDGYLITGVISAPTDDEYDAYAPYIQNMVMSISPSEVAAESDETLSDLAESEAE